MNDLLSVFNNTVFSWDCQVPSSFSGRDGSTASGEFFAIAELLGSATRVVIAPVRG